MAKPERLIFLTIPPYGQNYFVVLPAGGTPLLHADRLLSVGNPKYIVDQPAFIRFPRLLLSFQCAYALDINRSRLVKHRVMAAQIGQNLSFLQNPHLRITPVLCVLLSK